MRPRLLSGEPTGRGGLHGRLMQLLRPEFRADVLIFDADDPVFGTGACRVPSCRRHIRNRGLSLQL